MDKFIADKISVVDLLTKKDLTYRIPFNQREYSWESEYIDNFWEYLTDTDDNYFLGTIVLNTEFLNEGYKEIVDGQQRLLTITIFLSILRNVFLELKEVDRSNAIHSNYIGNVNDDQEDIGYKIIPGKSLNNFYNKFIQERKGNIFESKPETKEEKRVKKNYEILYGKILEFIGSNTDNKVNKLSELREKVKNLELVFIEVSSGEDAFTFFETINATGMKLSTADVLKNLVFKHTKFSDLEIDEIWEGILSNLQNNEEQFDITRFIRHFWLSKFDKVTDRKLYLVIKNSIKKYKGKNPKYKTYDDFISDLSNNSFLYGQILYPNENDFQGILKPFYNLLNNLKILGVVQPYPTILSLMRLIKKDNFTSISTPKAINLIKVIENFIFVYKITGKSPSPLEGLFSKIAIKYIDSVNSKSQFEKAILDSINEINKMMPEEDEFIVNIKSKLKYTTKKKDKDILRYFFDKYFHSTNEIKFENINIEHIYPQNPAIVDDDYNNEIINSIGNLTILGPSFNRSASNKLPIDKVSYYEESEIIKNHEISNYIKQNGWTVEQIEKRTLDISEKSWDIFKIN